MNLTLLTDLYELTMAYGYWKLGMHQKEVVFHHFFRKKPFQGSFAIATGLGTLLEHLSTFHFSPSDLAYLASLKGEGGAPLFEEAFLTYLSTFRLTSSIEAVPEGTPVFAYEPLLRVQGPIIEAQLLESLILNTLNFQSLIATKSARICFAAGSDPVIEFGLRRAQGPDGALSAARAAYIGGCSATSNILAGKTFGIPVKGTHAHSWIMAFPSEQEAFKAWAKVMPHNLTFLIDTYESLEGARRAIQIAKQASLPFSVRLDSGDLAQISIEVRKLLNEAGFPHAPIMASNELDEHIITDLKRQGAKIDIWGVGTNLVTGKDQPALDGVYKLAAIKSEAGWDYKIKISEQITKVTDPGILQVRRFMKGGQYVADMIYDTSLSLPPSLVITPILDRLPSKRLDHEEHTELLIPVMKNGALIYSSPPLSEIRERAAQELAKFPPATRRFLNPQPYLAGLESSLYERKQKLIEEGF